MIWLLFAFLVLVLHPVWSLTIVAFYLGGFWIGCGAFLLLFSLFAVSER